ncbi:hypothetical protein [Streptomonospora litoralis]|uniref:Uncharacterized protein n=1 Tax=Streptomonospora litoralis TaxID=2498135 RepID=A0A4P6Q7K3_9ACTN|nr:hypothetical protein [Streptomonospora litoralis]QBI54944.1 hypothetical protein EKD16_15860 [Streptomonospora litoralis]
MDADDATAAVLLGMLKARYSHRWSIRRTEHLWIATAVDPGADHAPTVIHPDLERFVRELEDPPARAGRPSILSAAWVAAQFDRVGEDGAYYRDEPPST